MWPGNVHVAATAERLLRALPDVAAKAKRQREMALAFSRTFRAEVERLGPSTEAMKRAANESRAAGDNRVTSILASSHAARAALDFGDDFARALAELHEHADTIADLVGATAA